MVFPIKARRSLGDGWIKAIEVICGSDHEDSIVGFETVDFVKEVTACGVCDEGVDVFEYEEAGGHCAGMHEDLADGGSASLGGVEVLYVERGDWIFAGGEEGDD